MASCTAMVARAPKMTAVALAATLVLGARESRAASDDGKEPVRVGTELAPGCPDAPFFYQQVRARTRHVRLAHAEEAARELRVTVRAEGPTFRGRLEVQTRDGASSSREVSGRKCNEVLSALAFVAALGIDPNASLTSTEPLDEPSEEESAPSPPSEELPIAPPVSEIPPRPRPRVAVSRPEPRAWNAFVGLDATTLIGILPVPAWGGRLWIDARTLQKSSLWAPAFRVALGGAATVDHAIGPGMARFQLVTAKVDACPLRWTRASWSAEPCAFVEGGLLFGQGVRSPSPQSSQTGYLALGPLARLSFLPSTRVRIGLEGGFVFPLLRANVSFSEHVAYRVPAWGGTLGLGVGLKFM